MHGFLSILLFLGAARVGKTFLARAMPGILPERSIEESLDVTQPAEVDVELN